VSDLRETATGTRLALLKPGLESSDAIDIADQTDEIERFAGLAREGKFCAVLLVGLLPDAQIEIGGNVDDVGEMLVIAKRLERAAMRALDEPADTDEP
jgi:hypothetical protein